LWADSSAPERTAEDQVRGLLTRHFRPEFLNRVDEVVVFHRLTKENLARIVEIQLGRLALRIVEAGYRLEVTPEARAHLAEAGYDPVYGARPLKRVIQRELQDPLALRLLQGEFQPGEMIRVDTAEGGLTFTAVVEGEAISA
jgi:ATP-dependent Clp protease ATP-binding subunit ClpB